MKEIIPTYSILNLSGKTKADQDIFFTEHQIKNHGSPINVPYRSNYYGVGLCIKGTASLKANLETYKVQKGCLVTMSPPVIKQWIHLSAGYKTMAVFFTRDFFIRKNLDKGFLDGFSYFDPNARPVTALSVKEAETIAGVLNGIRSKLGEQHLYGTEIVRNMVEILLYEAESAYAEQRSVTESTLTRGGLLSAEFKKLVCIHFSKDRSVQYFAGLLHVSPKHLTEVVREQTGKSAKEWIDELVILEAKVLLQNSSLTIGNIADQLSFSDQAAFGKFFKNQTGQSPLAYRQSL